MFERLYLSQIDPIFFMMVAYYFQEPQMKLAIMKRLAGFILEITLKWEPSEFKNKTDSGTGSKINTSADSSGKYNAAKQYTFRAEDYK